MGICWLILKRLIPNANFKTRPANPQKTQRIQIPGWLYNEILCCKMHQHLWPKTLFRNNLELQASTKNGNLWRLVEYSTNPLCRSNIQQHSFHCRPRAARCRAVDPPKRGCRPHKKTAVLFQRFTLAAQGNSWEQKRHKLIYKTPRSPLTLYSSSWNLLSSNIA